MRDFVTSAGSGRFEGTSRSESGSGADEPGTTSINVTQVSGSFKLPARLHVIEDSGDYLFEAIEVEAGSYVRSAASRSELNDESWEFEASPKSEQDSSAAGWSMEGIDGEGLSALSAAAGVLGSFGGPFDLVEVLGRLKAVRRVSTGVLEASVALRDLLPEEMVKAIEQEATKAKETAEAEPGTGDVEPNGSNDLVVEEGTYDEFAAELLEGVVTFRLVHDDTGRLDEMTITTETGDGDDRTVERTSLKFSAWGSSLAIDAPASADVDPTPGIDEDDLAAFRAFPVLAPRALPKGMVLHGATVASEDAEEESCNAVDLGYGRPERSTGIEDHSEGDDAPSFLNITLTEASCPWAERHMAWFGNDGPAEPVEFGPYRGELVRSQLSDDAFGEALIQVKLTVDDVDVDVHSSLPRDELLAILASLAPLDLASQPLDLRPPPPTG